MKQGRVVHIRVSPGDCMSCVDVATKVGLVMRGTSFAQVVSIALKALLETARDKGAIPYRTGQEYTELMAPFVDHPSMRARKLDVTEALNPQNSEIVYPTVPLNTPMPKSTPQRARLEARASELRFQRSQDPDNFSQEQQAELESIADQLAGLA